MTKETILVKNISLIVALLLTIGLAGFKVLGQSSASTINGAVTDQHHNVVAGATVTLSNPAKNFVRTQTTNENGRFNFTLIPPGNYQISVEAKGFKRAVLADVNALVDKPTEVMVGLEVGNVTESVTVSAASGEVLLNTQDATLGNNFVNKQITQLPLEAKNVTALLTLQPGVTSNGYVAGARSDQSNVTLDGVDINDAQTTSVSNNRDNPTVSTTLAGPVSGPVLRLNAEAIEEFRVSTVTTDAVAGRSSGAQIELVTKSGTNNLHGSLFESHRNTITTANDYFNKLN